MARLSETDAKTILQTEPEIVEDLQSYLEKEDMVILIDINGANLLTEILCMSEAIRISWKRAAILSTVNFPVKPGKHIYRTISEEEMRMLLNIYLSYEASDKLFLFSYSKNYGSLWNYVNNGLISEEEMVEALFV